MEEMLFDLTQIEAEAKCAKCNTGFAPKGKHNIFCSNRCRQLAEWGRHTASFEDRAKLVSIGFDLPPSGELNQRDSEAVELYARKCGLTSIARMQGVSKAAVRKSLIKAGVYRPDPKMNGRARKGQGRQSRILKAQRKGRNLRRESIRKEWRHKVAVCLWNLRGKVGVETTCKQNRWAYQTVMNRLRERKVYLAYREKFKAKFDQMNERRKQRFVSVKYANEESFQVEIQKWLEDAGIEAKREAMVGESRSKVDFEIGDLAIECKTSTTTGDAKKLIGQMLVYSVEGNKKPVALIPDDVVFPGTELKVIKHLGLLGNQ